MALTRIERRLFYCLASAIVHAILGRDEHAHESLAHAWDEATTPDTEGEGR